jgi:hypothetical protein
MIACYYLCYPIMSSITEEMVWKHIYLIRNKGITIMVINILIDLAALRMFIICIKFTLNILKLCSLIPLINWRT